jgi:hypothetical protein
MLVDLQYDQLRPFRPFGPVSPRISLAFAWREKNILIVAPTKCAFLSPLLHIFCRFDVFC